MHVFLYARILINTLKTLTQPTDNAVVVGTTAQATVLPCTGARLRKATRRTTMLYEAFLRPIGVTLNQYSLLWHLNEQATPMQQLALKLEMDRTTLTRNLSGLLKNGWAHVVTGTDARQRCVQLTPLGAQVREQAHTIWKQAQIALQDTIGFEHTQALNQLLDETLLRLHPALAELQSDS